MKPEAAGADTAVGIASPVNSKGTTSKEGPAAYTGRK
jgi:hypothetical protein